MNTQGAHRYEDRLLEFAYGELPAAEARSIEAHVKGCARCSGALRELEGVRQQMSQLAPEPAPDAGLESLLAYAQQSARRAQAGPAPTRGIRRWMFGLVGTASLAAVLLVVGVVSTRTSPELNSLAPEALKKEAAREALRAEVATPAPAAAPAPEPQLAQGWTEGQQGQSKDQAEQPQPVAGAAAEKPASEKDAQVGKAVGNEYVQRVDVEDRKLGTRESPQYRGGSDMLDRGQNFVPGRGTRPVLPTSGEPSVASRKSAPLPADDEFTFPSESKTKSSKAPASPKKKAMDTSLAGSGGGLGNALDSVGGTRGPAPVAAAAPESYDSDDSAPAEPSADPGGADRLALNAPPPPAQKLAEETASRRRGAEPQEREQARTVAMAKEEAPAELAKNAQVTRQAAPEPTPAPAPAGPSSRAATTPQMASPDGTRLGLGAASGAAGAKGDLSTAPAGRAPATPPAQVAEAPRTASKSRDSAPSAQELFAEANRARAGSPEEIDALIAAVNAGLSGKTRISALQRLCTGLERQGDARAFGYCTAWANADPDSAIAARRAKTAEERLQKARAKAKPAAAEPMPAVKN